MREEFEKLVVTGKIEGRHVETLVQLATSGCCMHRSWGFGRIKTVDTIFGRFTIDFPGKPGHTMDLAFAADSLKPISKDHVLARKAADLEGLRQMAATHHLELVKTAAGYRCRLHDGPTVSGHRPSVDVLFRSVARNAGMNAIGVILTGMGKDGAEGLLELREASAITLGQDEESSLIYGMPRVAFERGAVMRQHPLSQMADAVMDACAIRAPAASGIRRAARLAHAGEAMERAR